jgi:hypothetical protein
MYSHSAQLLGAERALVAEVRALTARGIDVLVVVPRSGPLVPLLSEAGATVATCSLPPWLARTKAWPVFLARLLGAVVTFPRLRHLTRRFRPCVAYTNSWVIAE